MLNLSIRGLMQFPKYIGKRSKRKSNIYVANIGILSVKGMSSWASSSFIISKYIRKKDGRVRWVSDLRELNKVIVRRQYPLPVIKDALKSAKDTIFPKIDASMQYYTFELNDENKDLCTINTSSGKFKYNGLPMRLKCTPNIAQETMTQMFSDLQEHTEIYIDDSDVFLPTWDHYLKLTGKIYKKLQDNGYTVNLLKCEWGVKKANWIGYWPTPVGLKLRKNKTDAILKMEPPTTIKQLRGFIGAINYYRDMWPRRSHILSPLTDAMGQYSRAKNEGKRLNLYGLEKYKSYLKK